MKRNKERRPDLSDFTNDKTEIVRIEGTRDGTTYVWDSRAEHLHDIRSTFPDQSARVKVIGNKSRDVLFAATLTETRLFVAFAADCFDPPAFFILADSWEEAYTVAEDDMPTIQLDKEDPHVIKDYALDTDSPTCGFNSHGRPIDTEALQIWEMKLTRLETA